MKNKKGFSLIELIAVITILAVLVLITIPVVKKIVYESDKYDGTDGNKASKMMLDDAGVEYVQLPYEIKLDLNKVE